MSRRRYYDDDYDDDYYSWKIDTKQAKRDFMNYANKEKRIEQEGFEKMGKTLGIDIYTDIFITYFLYKCDTKNIEYLTEDQYIQGLTAFKCNTMQEVKNKIMDIKGELLLINEDDFQKFYYYLFDLNVSGSEKDKKTKSLSYDIVELYFKALFCNQFDKVTEFLEFLRFKNVGLKWDEWRTFLDFVRQKIDTFPKDYYVSDYYPTLIDDFYYWYCQKHNIPIPKEEEEY
jgi:hypothetical protein